MSLYIKRFPLSLHKELKIMAVKNNLNLRDYLIQTLRIHVIQESRKNRKLEEKKNG